MENLNLSNKFSDKRFKPIKVYEDKVGRIFFISKENRQFDKSKDNVFGLNGQMNSWFGPLDKYHLTKGIAYQHNFRPYIEGRNNFIYVQNYPLLQGKEYRNSITVETFTKSLLAGIEHLKLEKVYIAGHSCGGLMALQASKNQRVEKVVAAASPIFPTLFADIPRLDKLYKQGKLEKEEILIYRFVKAYVNYDYGYTKDYAKGCVDLLETYADWKKSKLIFGSIECDKPKNPFQKASAMIQRIDGLPNDSVVGFNKQALKDYPWYEINYGSHFDLIKEDIVSTEYNMLIEEQVKEKRIMSKYPPA